MKKIDIHIHSRETHLSVGNSKIPTPLELRDSIYPDLNVDMGILMPLANFNITDPDLLEGNCREANEEAYHLTQKYPELFSWFCFLDPQISESKNFQGFSNYIKMYKEKGAKGVGEIFSNIYFDDMKTQELLHSCEEHNMPILFHMSPKVDGPYGLVDDLGLPRLKTMLDKFPKLKFIGHSQVFWSEISSDVTAENRNGYPEGKVTPGAVPALMREHKNLYCDLSARSGYTALVRDPQYAYSFLEEFQDRLFFGTDYLIPRDGINLHTFLELAHTEGKISKKAYEKIIRKNAEKIFGFSSL